MITQDQGSTGSAPADALYTLHSYETDPFVVNYAITVRPGPNRLPPGPARYAYVIGAGNGRVLTLSDQDGRVMLTNCRADLPLRYPLPGQAVRRGDEIGIINGLAGHPTPRYRLCFGGNTFFGTPRRDLPGPLWVNTYESAELTEVAVADLAPTGEMVPLAVFRWQDRPRDGGEETYTITVPVWRLIEHDQN